MEKAIVSLVIALFLFDGIDAGVKEITISPFSLLGGGFALETAYELTDRVNIGAEMGIQGLFFKPDVSGDALSGFNAGVMISYKIWTLWKSLEIRPGFEATYIQLHLQNASYTWNMVGPQPYFEVRQKLGKYLVWRAGIGGLISTNEIQNENLKKWVDESSAGQVIITADAMIGIQF